MSGRPDRTGAAGKEARKAEPGKEGLLGVEGVPDALILQGLTTALESAAPRADAAKSRAITYTDLYDWGISGTANSAETAVRCCIGWAFRRG